MRWKAFYGLVFITGTLISPAAAQSTSPTIDVRLYKPSDADSSYILKFWRPNNFRVTYGTHGAGLAYGTTREGNQVNSAVYTNVTDLLGFGMTYKFIDFDAAFSLPQSKLQDVGLQDLKQFRLTGSITSRKFILRGYYIESSGIIAEDQKKEFKSAPDVSLLNAGAQFTWCFNFKKYSVRAAAFQDELQYRSAGSFMLRGEPFYREVSVGSAFVPPAKNVPSLYGEQANLHTVYATGLLIMPGYGFTWAMKDGKYFISPMVFFGGGFGINHYQGNQKDHTSINNEWEGAATLNMGYNGVKTFIALRSSYEMRYFNLNPSYFTITDLRVNLTVGYRFLHLEKAIPVKLF